MKKGPVRVGKGQRSGSAKIWRERTVKAKDAVVQHRKEKRAMIWGEVKGQLYSRRAKEDDLQGFKFGFEQSVKASH
jgi:hypothetical protein